MPTLVILSISGVLETQIFDNILFTKDKRKISSEYIKDVQIGRVCRLSDHRPIHLQIANADDVSEANKSKRGLFCSEINKAFGN